MLEKYFQLWNKMLLLALVDYHSTRFAESHETVTLSHTVPHILAQHKWNLNKKMCKIMRSNIQFRICEMFLWLYTSSPHMIFSEVTYQITDNDTAEIRFTFNKTVLQKFGDNRWKPPCCGFCRDVIISTKFSVEGRQLWMWLKKRQEERGEWV